MSTVPANSSFEFISPLALRLSQFLALKHAMGYRYREEGRALRELDRFLNSRLSEDDPLITSAIVHDYVARRGTESETTRAHRLTLIREVCRFLRLDDAALRNDLPGNNSPQNPPDQVITIPFNTSTNASTTVSPSPLPAASSTPRRSPPGKQPKALG